MYNAQNTTINTMQSGRTEGLFMDSSKAVQIVKKDNRLIEAKYKLSIHQQRVLYTLLDVIHTSDEDFKHYNINIADIAQKFELENSKDLYAQMQDAISDLVTKKITFNQGQDTVVMAWLSYARYRKGQGNVEISFHKDLKPYLLQLKSHFTQYQISAVAQFKSSYSIRFYELLKMYEYLGKGGQFYREFTLKELRDYMQIEKGDYRLFADFRRYVIESSVREINNFSDINIVQVDYIKSGRAVSEVHITAEPKNQMMIDIQAEQMDLVLVSKDETKEPSEAIQALVSFGIAQETAKKWARKFGKGRVLRNISYTLAMQEAGKVKTPILYLSKALEEDYGKAWEAEKVKQKDVIKKAKSDAQSKEQESERKLERERKERDEILAKFIALSDTEKEALRDMYSATLGRGVMLTKWKQAGDEPEKQGIFLATFSIYLKQNNLV